VSLVDETGEVAEGRRKLTVGVWHIASAESDYGRRDRSPVGSGSPMGVGAAITPWSTPTRVVEGLDGVTEAGIAAGMVAEAATAKPPASKVAKGRPELR
jgi:hypothetical protein